MKIAAKVFLIFGMVAVPSAALSACLGIWVFPSMVLGIIDPYGRLGAGLFHGLSVAAVLLLAVAAGSIVVGVLTYKKLDTAKSKNELIALGILSIFFVSLLAGIFTLCVPDSDLQTPSEPEPNIEQQV